MMEFFCKKHSNLIKGICSFVLFFSTIYIQKLLVIILNIKKVTVKNAIVINFLSSIIIACILILVYRKDLIREWKIYKKDFSKNIDIGFKYWLIGLVCMMISNFIITSLLNIDQATNEKTVQRMISVMPYLLVISAGIIAPINEEIIFRKVFRDNIKNNLIFILISGIIFGYMHVSTATTFAQFLYIIPYSSLGIAFAVMYSKTNTVFTSMSMHMFHNTILSILSIIV